MKVNNIKQFKDKLKEDIKSLKQHLTGSAKSSWEYATIKARIETAQDILNVLDQLDEPEITEDQAYKKIVETLPISEIELKGHIHQLVAFGGVAYVGHATYGRAISDNQVTVNKPELPQHIANFVDRVSEYALCEVFNEDWLYEYHEDIAEWLYDNTDEENQKREFELVTAMRHGYTVKTEPKYYVMNNDNRMMLVRKMDGKTITEADPFKIEDMYEAEKESHRLTEQEIKDYDKRYWAFAERVE